MAKLETERLALVKELEGMQLVMKPYYNEETVIERRIARTWYTFMGSRATACALPHF